MCVAKPLKYYQKMAQNLKKNLKFALNNFLVKIPKTKKNGIRFIYPITTMEYNAALGLAQLIY